MADTFPVDYSTEVGRVRKYIPDVRQIDGEFIFTDEELQSFIDDENILLGDVTPWHILRAAAMAMIAIANDENLILKKLVTEDLETDGPGVAKALLASAQELLKRAATAETASDDIEVFYAVDYRPLPPRFDWR